MESVMLFTIQFCKRTQKMKLKWSQNIPPFLCVKRYYQLKWRKQECGLMKTALGFPGKHLKVQRADISHNIFQACSPRILYLLGDNELVKHIQTLHPRHTSVLFLGRHHRFLFQSHIQDSVTESIWAWVRRNKILSKLRNRNYPFWSCLFDEDA